MILNLFIFEKYYVLSASKMVAKKQSNATQIDIQMNYDGNS